MVNLALDRYKLGLLLCSSRSLAGLVGHWRRDGKVEPRRKQVQVFLKGKWWLWGIDKFSLIGCIVIKWS